MTVAVTSAMAYRNLDPQRIDNCQKRVLFCIGGLYKPSNKDLSRVSGLPINSVTGRTNELVDLELVCEGGRKVDPFTRKTVKWWTLTKAGKDAYTEIVRNGGAD